VGQGAERRERFLASLHSIHTNDPQGKVGQMANDSLSAARKAKNDEFYTFFADVERQMEAFVASDRNVFSGKTVLLPCDDPQWSNFTRYFSQNFERLGLRKLISTCYSANGNGKICVLERGADDPLRLDWEYLAGNGDFRSEEVTKLRDESDIIVTNPPFSLFREFFVWILEAKKQFAVISSENAITYKCVFPLLKANLIWLGGGLKSDHMNFQLGMTGKKKTINVMWLTNIDDGLRNPPIQLMTEAENIELSKHNSVRGVGYRRYDNFDAIDVPFVDAIPSDYQGVMGVPITFMLKYNPDQFEILGITRSFDDSGLRTKTYDAHIQVSADGTSVKWTTPGGPLIKVDTAPNGIHYKVGDDILVAVYVRILIRHRRSAGTIFGESVQCTDDDQNKGDHHEAPTSRIARRRTIRPRLARKKSAKAR